MVRVTVRFRFSLRDWDKARSGVSVRLGLVLGLRLGLGLGLGLG